MAAPVIPGNDPISRYTLPPADPRHRRRSRRLLAAVPAVGLALVLVAAAALAFVAPALTGAHTAAVTVLGPEPTSLDPAVQADAGSAQIVAQLFESLTDVDATQHVEPALAASWQTLDAGRRVVFHLRPNLEFSDGSALRASDVVSSWLRVLDPSRHGQLAALLDDVSGASAYHDGTGPAAAVGLRAIDDSTLEVSLASPAADFPAIASSPTLAVVPASIDRAPGALQPGSFVGSGGFVLSAQSSTGLTLTSNSHYWAGRPAIDTVHVETSIGGRSPVDDFRAGSLDYTPIAPYDASWIAYDRTLGPSLRSEPSPTVEYYGFDTMKPPFSNVHVRRAFALGVDWRRLVALASDPTIVPATSMVPPGLPGRSATDFAPQLDLTTARAELAAAGYPDGKGFPKVTLVTAGGEFDEGLIRQLHDNLGIDIGYETLDADSYSARLLSDPPAMWSLGWVADYPGANDFLGLLLGTGKTNNYGRWSSPDFDAAISTALSASDPAAMQKAFDQAQAIVRDEGPVVPVSYQAGYALAAPGLLGAAPNGQGLVRYAGLAWAGGGS